MNLILEIESLADEAAEHYAAGVVVLDAQTSQPVHEAGYVLGALATSHAADYLGLIKAIEVALGLNPEDVEIRCASQALVNQITDAEPIGDEAIVPLYEQAVMSLLRFDAWRIRAVEKQAHRPAAELAQRALESGADVMQAPRAREQAAPAKSGAATIAAHPALPLRQRPFTVELLDEPGRDCPARCRAAVPYIFGPDTPGGFCVHAARAALSEGPLTWDDPDQKQLTTLCPKCEVPLRIAVVE